MIEMFNRLFSYLKIPARFCIRSTQVNFKTSYYVYNKIQVQFYNFTSINCVRKLAVYNKKSIANDNNSVSDQSKAIIISKLNFKCDEDALPFYKLSIKTLSHIYKTTQKDVEIGYCKNRLYYLAERLKFSPTVLSKSIANRSFIYTLSFDWLEKSLKILLDMGVPEDRIVRDLWVLKYYNKTIEERLLRVQKMGVENLYPWMVRCSEKILHRFISISHETKTVLGDIKSKKIYLAKRLNTTPKAVEQMYFTIPALKRIRPTKLKKFLDFLLDEGFEVEDIAKKPRVLSASQETVMIRLEKLRKLGLKEINLNVLCRSRKDFKKYCESLESITDKKVS